MKKHRNHLKDHMVSWEEMAPGALVCPGSWKLRTSQGWALGKVMVGPTPARTHVAIVMTSGKRVRRLSGATGSRAKREMGPFPVGNWKRGGEWHNAISLLVYSLWTDALLGTWFCLLFSLLHLLNPDTAVNRADPWACAPVEQRAKWERMILNKRAQTRSHWCVFYGLHCS